MDQLIWPDFLSSIESSKHDESLLSMKKDLINRLNSFEIQALNPIENINWEKRDSDHNAHFKKSERDCQLLEKKMEKSKMALDCDLLELSAKRSKINKLTDNVLTKAQDLDSQKTQLQMIITKMETYQGTLRKKFDAVCYLKEKYKKALYMNIKRLPSEEKSEPVILVVSFVTTSVTDPSVEIAMKDEGFAILKSHPPLPFQNQLKDVILNKYDMRGFLVYVRNLFNTMSK